MAQGRGSVAVAVLIVVVVIAVVQCDFADAATYTVGDKAGWTFNMANWPAGKKFRASDVLVFKYNAKIHNTVAVSAAGYNSCTAPRGSKVYTSGNDRITLARGTNYFICSFPGHCQAGMKIAVTAS